MWFKLWMVERFPHWADADVRVDAVFSPLRCPSGSRHSLLLPRACHHRGVEGLWGGRAGNVTVGFVLLHSRRIAATSWHSHGEFVSSFSLISCFPAELAHQLFPDQLLLCTEDSTHVFFKYRFGYRILDKFWLFPGFHTGSKQRNSDFCLSALSSAGLNCAPVILLESSLLNICLNVNLKLF